MLVSYRGLYLVGVMGDQDNQDSTVLVFNRGLYLVGVMGDQDNQDSACI